MFKRLSRDKKIRMLHIDDESSKQNSNTTFRFVCVHKNALINEKERLNSHLTKQTKRTLRATE